MDFREYMEITRYLLYTKYCAMSRNVDKDGIVTTFKQFMVLGVVNCVYKELQCKGNV